VDTRTVYIVDDNADFRESTAWMLEGFGYSVQEFGTPQSALRVLEKKQQEGLCCLLLDVRMPGMSGLELHDRLNQRKLRVPVVYMTGHGDVPLAVEAMKKGAITFLEKPLQFDALEAALTLAFNAANQSPAAAETDAAKEEFRAGLALLTPRETQVMQSIVSGKANKVSAIDLCISVKTVELHRARVMKKLKVRSGPELVRMVMSCQ